MAKALKVYKASAGSGKTFTLATEYIRLLVENPQSYRNILAVTFTNKATEEMKTRILSQLYGIWRQLPQSASYLEAIRRRTGLEPQLISERAGLALRNLIHNYSYFRVETIDTFFQSVLRNMARELDLTPNLRIGLNDTQVEEMAVDRLIEDLSTTDVMLQWIMKYILENISDDKGWNVIGHIKHFGRTIFRDTYKEVSRQLDQRLKEPGFFEHYTAQLKDIRQDALDRAKELGTAFTDTLADEGLAIDDIPYGRNGVCGFFLKLQNGVFDEGIIGKRVTDAVADPTKWYKKTSPHREHIHMLADTTLCPLLTRAIGERPRLWKLYKSADLTLRHLHQLRLLSSIEHKVRQLNEDANRFLLSDTQQLLHSLIDGSDSPFIFEKIGTQLEHVMIDEFQDTSTVQWQNFKVLLSETISHEEGSSLIVGDVKQSIYRWRSGDWRLLNNISQQFDPALMDIETLDTNYRSEPGVIAFNNAFFRHAAELEYLALREQNDQEAGQLRQAYADVEQKVPDNRRQGGAISITLLPAEDYQEQVLSLLTDTVGELTGRGVRQNDIAILVRTNALIPLIARRFQEEMPGVSIVSDEAFRLDASAAVCLIIQALHLLTHPQDVLAKATLVKTYQQTVLGNTASDEALLMDHEQLDRLLPEAYAGHFEQLLTQPLYELAESIAGIFQLDRLKGQNAYVCAFYDQLTKYAGEAATDFDAFVKEWEETLCAKTIQSDEADGIRLISIHKSKGLEFGHVVIPFCDWQLEKQMGNILWCKPTEAPFDALPIIPIDYSQKQMTGTVYEHDYLHEHLQNTVDNLNLLYVAFTRASRSLTVIGKRHAKNTRSALIEQCLPLVAEELQGATLEGLEDEQQPLRMTIGDIEGAQQGAGAQKQKEASSPLTASGSDNPFLAVSEPLPVAIGTHRPKVAFRQSNRSRDFVQGDDGDNRQRQYIQTGSVLHQIFATIRTADDIPGALQQLQAEGVLYDEHITAERITKLLRQRLADPRVAGWFSPRWQLFNECTILTVEDGKAVERRPDRVMTDGSQWVVVDFKFGSPKEEYHDQVRQYMQLIATMHPTARITGYLWFVYSNQIIEVTRR